MDDDEMDDYDRYGRGGRYGFGGYGPYGDPYDDSEDDPYGDGYGPFGYGLYRDEMPWMGGYHAGPPRKVNPWAYGNEEQGLYTFKDAKGTVMKSNTRPEPTHTLVKPKLTPYPIKEAKLNELGMRIGSINFPVKVRYQAWRPPYERASSARRCACCRWMQAARRLSVDDLLRCKSSCPGAMLRKSESAVRPVHLWCAHLMACCS